MGGVQGGGYWPRGIPMISRPNGLPGVVAYGGWKVRCSHDAPQERVVAILHEGVVLFVGQVLEGGVRFGFRACSFPPPRSFLLVVGASFGSLMSVDPYFQGLFFVAQPTGGACPRVCVVCVRGLEQRANHSNRSR